MPFLDNVVRGLNIGIIHTLSCFTNVRTFGIAETMLVAKDDNSEGEIVRYPGMFGNDGEVEMIDINDRFAITVYHRLESITNSTDAKQAFGRDFSNREVVNMSLIVFAFRDKTLKPAYHLEAMIKDDFPGENRIENIQQSYYKIGNSSFDLIGLSTREYSPAPLNYPLLTGFEMKYRIESTYKKGCFINSNGCT